MSQPLPLVNAIEEYCAKIVSQGSAELTPIELIERVHVPRQYGWQARYRVPIHHFPAWEYDRFMYLVAAESAADAQWRSSQSASTNNT